MEFGHPKSKSSVEAIQNTYAYAIMHPDTKLWAFQVVLRLLLGRAAQAFPSNTETTLRPYRRWVVLKVRLCTLRRKMPKASTQTGGPASFEELRDSHLR